MHEKAIKFLALVFVSRPDSTVPTPIVKYEMTPQKKKRCANGPQLILKLLLFQSNAENSLFITTSSNNAQWK